ncbi:MAG: nucleotidyltransferase domain-containing protein, partial [Flavisolibacter sp.]|nr:nucleotidyltransferase domain-containing protein [Flavisolibacter sp.]
MVDVVKDNLNEIISICKKYHVQSLYLFGSAAREGDFKQNSDIEFIVCYSIPSTPDSDLLYKVENGKNLQ